MPIKDSRKKLLFDELHRLGPLSNQELADTFELSPASITQFLKPCISQGQLVTISAEDFPANREIGNLGASRKRRKATFYPNPDYGYFLSIEIGGDQLIFRKIDFSLQIIPEEPHYIPIGQNLDFIATVTEEILRISHGEPRNLLAVGLTVSGRRDPDTGLLSFSHDPLLPRGLDTTTQISSRIGLPCIMENDANALALFERFSGSARQSDHFMCLYINEGVGIGIFTNGSLYEGWQNQAGESGHWIIDPDGPLIKGIPQGSFEAYVSAPAVHRQLASIGIATNEKEAWDTLIIGLSSPGEAKPGLVSIQNQISRQTALLCINLFHIFAPEHIFVYGPLAARNLGLQEELIREAALLSRPDRSDVFKSVLIPRQDWKTAMALGTAKTALDSILQKK